MILNDSFPVKRLMGKKKKPTRTICAYTSCLNSYLRYIGIFIFSLKWFSAGTDGPRCSGRLPSSRRSGSCSSAYLGEENVIKQQLSFRLIFGDIGVGVHPKDFWGRVQRQSLCVFDVALVLQRWIPESQEVRNQLSCRTFSLRRENFQYSSYWVDEPVELDTKCFHFLSTWSKVKKKKKRKHLGRKK